MNVMGLQKSKYAGLALCLLLLSGCVTGNGVKIFKASSFGFLNNYDMALKDFEAGKVMEARARVLAIDPKREDYKQAQKLLKNKIDPSRLRLLRYYKAKGQKAEAAKAWGKATDLYLQAAEFSLKPSIFIGYSKAMDMKMRQARLDDLLEKRRLEDAVWLKWLDAYEPPQGIKPKDVAYTRMREYMQDSMEERAQHMYREAKRYLRKDMAGVAYIEIESYLRLMPDSELGGNLMEQVRLEMPKGLVIAKPKSKKPEPSTKKVRQSVSRKSAVPNKASKKNVQTLLAKGDWLAAKQAVLVYRRHGGEGADKFLERIEIGMERKAVALFAQGSQAFRQEHIDQAVKLWDEAVSLRPENTEYVNALRRAMQLQERLHLLRSEDKE